MPEAAGTEPAAPPEFITQFINETTLNQRRVNFYLVLCLALAAVLAGTASVIQFGGALTPPVITPEPATKALMLAGVLTLLGYIAYPRRGRRGKR
jgi:hypothetical protein